MKKQTLITVSFIIIVLIGILFSVKIGSISTKEPTVNVQKEKTKDAHTKQNSLDKTKESPSETIRTSTSLAKQKNIDITQHSDISELPIDLPLSWFDEITQMLYTGEDDFEKFATLVSSVPPDQYLPFLLETMDSSVTEVRSMVLKLATFVPNRAVLKLAEKGLKDSEDSIQRTSVRLVKAVGITSPEITDILKEMLNGNTSQSVKGLIASYFYEQNSDWLAEVIQGETLSGLQRLITESGRASQESVYAALVLCKIEQGNDELSRVLTQCYEDGRNQQGYKLAVAMAAGGALAKRGIIKNELKQDLIKNVSNDDKYVRASSIQGLTSFANDDDARKAIIQQVSKEEYSNVVYAIGEFGKSSKDNDLIQALWNRYDPTSFLPYNTSIVIALADMRKKEGFEELIQLMDNDNLIPPVRIAALQGLRRTTGQYFDYLPYDTSGSQYTALLKWKQYIKDRN